MQYAVAAPPSDTPADKVIALCTNYILALSRLPNAPGLAAQAFAGFWKKAQRQDGGEAGQFSSCWRSTPTAITRPPLLHLHPA